LRSRLVVFHSGDTPRGLLDIGSAAK